MLHEYPDGAPAKLGGGIAATAMRLGTSRFARLVGRALRRSARRKRTKVVWELDRGPTFANRLSEITFEARSAQLVVLQARPTTRMPAPNSTR